MNKAQYTQTKREKDSVYYDTLVQGLELRNQKAIVQVETATKRLETAQEVLGQANDHNKFTKGMTLLRQANYVSQANVLTASTGKNVARAKQLLNETEFLFGAEAKPELKQSI